MVGNYVADEAPQLHDGFGGSSQLDIEKIEFVANSKLYSILVSGNLNHLSRLILKRA